MSSVLKYLFFAFILYKSVESYLGIISPEEKPAKFADEEGCYVSKFDLVLKLNVPYSPKDGTTCEKYVCQENKETVIEGCGYKAVSDVCEKIPGDLNLAFPDCCDKVRCTAPDGSVTVF